MKSVLLLLGLVSSAAASAEVVRPDPAAARLAKRPLPTAVWDGLLKRYVDEKGRVDYTRLAATSQDRERFEALFASVAASSPKKTPELYRGLAAQEAYYLNVYNILVWKNVLLRLPKIGRVDEEKNFFSGTEFLVGGEAMSLDVLEKRIIRPTFDDPRVHMALNCASGGCPVLPREAFTAERLSAELDREARRFCSEPRNVRIDSAAQRIALSRIFDWYRDDFGGTTAAVIDWINRYRDSAAKLPQDAKVEYLDYDWTLNDVHRLKR